MVSAKSPFNRLPFLNLLHPSWLAGIISVGVHGALFAASPTFSSLGFDDLTQPELAAERRNVPLVELSAAEQQRLPDFSQPFYNFDTFDLDPLSPLFEKKDSATSGSPGSTTDDLLTQRSTSPLTGRSRSSYTPSIRIPFGIARPEQRRSNPVPTLPPTGTGETEPKPDGTASTTGNLPAPTPGEGNNPSNPGETTTGPSAADLERQPADPNGQAPATEGTDVAVGSNPTDVMTVEERLKAYTFDETATTPEEVETLVGEWLAAGQTLATEREVGVESPEGLLNDPIELPIDYGQQFCLAKEPQKGLIGAWIAPGEGLLGEPAVLKSTGYLGLNQLAVQRIKTLDFSSVKTFTGYQFEVVVNYDPENCIELGQTVPPQESAGTDSEAETPAAEPEPERAPAAETKPEIETKPE